MALSRQARLDRITLAMTNYPEQSKRAGITLTPEETDAVLRTYKTNSRDTELDELTASYQNIPHAKVRATLNDIATRDARRVEQQRALAATDEEKQLIQPNERILKIKALILHALENPLPAAAEGSSASTGSTVRTKRLLLTAPRVPAEADTVESIDPARTGGAGRGAPRRLATVMTVEELRAANKRLKELPSFNDSDEEEIATNTGKIIQRLSAEKRLDDATAQEIEHARKTLQSTLQADLFETTNLQSDFHDDLTIDEERELGQNKRKLQALDDASNRLTSNESKAAAALVTHILTKRNERFTENVEAIARAKRAERTPLAGYLVAVEETSAAKELAKKAAIWGRTPPATRRPIAPAKTDTSQLEDRMAAGTNLFKLNRNRDEDRRAALSVEGFDPEDVAIAQEKLIKLQNLRFDASKDIGKVSENAEIIQAHGEIAKEVSPKILLALKAKNNTDIARLETLLKSTSLSPDDRISATDALERRRRLLIGIKAALEIQEQQPAPRRIKVVRKQLNYQQEQVPTDEINKPARSVAAVKKTRMAIRPIAKKTFDQVAPNSPTAEEVLNRDPAIIEPAVRAKAKPQTLYTPSKRAQPEGVPAATVKEIRKARMAIQPIKRKMFAQVAPNSPTAEEVLNTDPAIIPPAVRAKAKPKFSYTPSKRAQPEGVPAAADTLESTVDARTGVQAQDAPSITEIVAPRPPRIRYPQAPALPPPPPAPVRSMEHFVPGLNPREWLKMSRNPMFYEASEAPIVTQPLATSAASEVVDSSDARTGVRGQGAPELPPPLPIPAPVRRSRPSKGIAAVIRRKPKASTNMSYQVGEYNMEHNPLLYQTPSIVSETPLVEALRPSQRSAPALPPPPPPIRRAAARPQDVVDPLDANTGGPGRGAPRASGIRSTKKAALIKLLAQQKAAAKPTTGDISPAGTARHTADENPVFRTTENPMHASRSLSTDENPEIPKTGSVSAIASRFGGSKKKPGTPKPKSVVIPNPLGKPKRLEESRIKALSGFKSPGAQGSPSRTAAPQTRVRAAHL